MLKAVKNYFGEFGKLMRLPLEFWATQGLNMLFMLMYFAFATISTLHSSQDAGLCQNLYRHRNFLGIGRPLSEEECDIIIWLRFVETPDKLPHKTFHISRMLADLRNDGFSGFEIGPLKVRSL